MDDSAETRADTPAALEGVAAGEVEPGETHLVNHEHGAS